MTVEPDPSAAEEIARLRHELADLQQTINAIRNGDLDAIVVGGPQGEHLYTQISADRPYRVIVEEMGDGALTVSERGVVLYANDRMAQLLARHRTQLLGMDVTDLVAPAAKSALSELLTAGPGTTRRSELELMGADGVHVPVLASVTGLRIDDVMLHVLIVADLTDQRQGARVLAEANAGLSRSARELEEAQRIGGIGSWYWDAATDEVEWSPQMYRIFGVDPRATGLTFTALLAATSHPDDAVLAIAARERALADRQPATLEQRVIHPNGEIRYTVTRSEVICGEDGAVIGMRGTTQDITDQRIAAEAVDEARQQLLRKKLELEEEHRVKESLQRAVLPARLPDAPGFRLAARYLPADRPALVGGDWYDAFPLPDGTVAVAVGDVAGHDLYAAATMGQMRNALRAYAFADGPPGSVLGRLNRLVDGLADSGLATAVFGLLDAGETSFRWACAGHPPPLVIGTDGARLLPPPVGMMLGANSEASFGDVVVPLRTGDLLVLYTDGLIERRNSDLDADFAALLRAADDLSGRSPEDVCAALLDRLVQPGSHEDDVCLLVMEFLR
jgi:PAS domain S-box-containing protein